MNSPPRVGVIHTSPATVDLFARLLRERVPSVEVVNVLDDSILPELGANDGNLDAVEPRWRDYARIVAERGVGAILNACSSIGALSARVQPDIAVPIVRVDAAMAAEAIARGSRVGVIATLATTLEPTRRLVAESAHKLGREVAVETLLVEGAYAALIGGDQARHDDLVAAALDRLVGANDVVVLAQASMARLLPRLGVAERAKVLASPPFAVEDVVGRLA